MSSCITARSAPRATRACRKAIKWNSRLPRARKARRQRTSPRSLSRSSVPPSALTAVFAGEVACHVSATLALLAVLVYLQHVDNKAIANILYETADVLEL